MEETWYSLPKEIRDGIRYVSAMFYPEGLMPRWRQMRSMVFSLSKQVKGYSLQQVIEELEHFDFFREYFKEEPLKDVKLPDSYVKLFDGLMEDLRSPRFLDDVATRFHVITEGVLATVGLKILNETSRKYGLTKFNEGVRNIIEDEARHVNYGLSLVQDPDYAVRRVEELYPLAVQIITDSREKLEPMGYSLQELLALMEELKRARVEKIRSKVIA